MRLDITPSAGMIFPGPETIIMGGRECVARELRIRHVARLEREAAALLEHPFAGLEHHLDAADAISKGDPERQQHLDALWSASDQWPPRMGSPMYWRAIATVGIAPLYLRLTLRATRPGMTRDDAEVLMDSMGSAEWIAIDRIAHGKGPRWEGGGDDRGINWRSVVNYLTDRRKGVGLSLKEVGDLYLSQLYFLMAGDTPYGADLPDRPVPLGVE